MEFRFSMQSGNSITTPILRAHVLKGVACLNEGERSPGIQFHAA